MSLPTTEWTLISEPVPSGSVLARTVSTAEPGRVFKLDANGDLAQPIQYIGGREAVAQGIATRLGILRGELFWNLDYGIPYFTELLGQRFSEPKVVAIFRDAILDAPDVATLLSLRATFDSRTRVLRVPWIVQSIYGRINGATRVN